MSRFRRNLQYLINAYPAEQGDFKIPDTLVPALFLTEPLLGSSLYEVASTLSATGSLGAITLDAVVKPGPGKVWYVLSFLVSHNDGVNRDLNARVRSADYGLGQIPINIAETAVGVGSATKRGPPRPFWLPSGWNLRAEVAVLGGAAALSLEVFYVEVPLGITPPPC